MYAFLSKKVFDFKNLFPSLDLFTMALCGSLVTKMFSFIVKIPVFLKYSRSEATISNLKMSTSNFSA